VRVKQPTVSEGLGGSTTANGTLMIAGDRSRSEEANTEVNTAAAGVGWLGWALLKAVTKVIRISATTAPATSFEDPAGFNKKD
jgi:hypothetical protein